MKVTDEEVANKFIQLKQSAFSRNIKFTLSLKRVRQLLSTKRCYYTKVEFVDVIQDKHSFTIDRVDNNLGYTDTNTVACTQEINFLKKNLTIDQITLLYKCILKHQNKLK